MKKFGIAIILIIVLFSSIYSNNELDFCGRTIFVILEPELSDYRVSLVDDSFFGLDKNVIIENISIIENEKAIEALIKAKREFRAIFRISLPSDDKAIVLSLIEKIKKIEGVITGEPNYYDSLNLTQNDQYWNNAGLWGLRSGHGANAVDAWDITTGSRNIRVGVIDTGILTGHLDFYENNESNLTSGWNFESINWDPFINPNPNIYIDPNANDTQGHGTHVAGTIGAVGNNNIGVVGVNWHVTLVPLKVSTSGSSIGVEPRAAAIYHAISTWGTDEQISILSHSIGGYGTNTTLRTRISHYPGLFVWAAGNGDEYGNPINLDDYTQINTFNIPNIIAVGAISSNGARAYFSNYSSSGNYLPIYAPGVNIYSTYLNNGYVSNQGTSMAAPHVSGVAALLLSVNPEMTAEEMKTIIVNNGTNHVINIPESPGSIQTVPQTVKKLAAFSAVFNASNLDLQAYTLSGPSSLVLNQTGTYTFMVKNNSSSSIGNYTVDFRNGNTIL